MGEVVKLQTNRQKHNSIIFASADAIKNASIELDKRGFTILSFERADGQPTIEIETNPRAEKELSGILYIRSSQGLNTYQAQLLGVRVIWKMAEH